MNLKISKIIRPVLISLLIGLQATCIHAQDQLSPNIITPGSGELSVEQLRPFSHTYELHLINGEQKTFAGTLTDELRIHKKENIIERVQVLERPNQPPQIDSVRATLDSLTPLSHYSVNKNRTTLLTYNSSGVKGDFHRNGSSATEINETFNDPYFDSSWIDLIIRMIPFKKGKQVILQTHEITYNGDSDFLPYEIEVMKQATLPMANGNEETVWIVNQERYRAVTTYYIKRNSLDLLKAKIPVTPREYLIMTKSF